MGRNIKQGLDRFPVEIDLFHDPKVRKLIGCQGGKAITVYALLLCIIYERGYYMRWSESLSVECSQLTGFDGAYISEVISSCLSLGLFCKAWFESDHVLTSRGIQKRYAQMCRQNRRVCRIADYDLLSATPAPKSRPTKPKPQPKSKLQPAPTPVAQPTLFNSQPLPTPPPALSLDEEIAQLKAADIWLDNLQTLYHMPADQLRLHLDRFRQECLANGLQHHKDIQDAKRHFNNWMRIVTSNHNNNDQNKHTGKAQRRGNLLSADGAKAKDYGAAL